MKPSTPFVLSNRGENLFALAQIGKRSGRSPADVLGILSPVVALAFDAAVTEHCAYLKAEALRKLKEQR